MIQIVNIDVVFNPSTPQEVKALDNVSLQINEGEFLVIAGSNGSGKSTLLNVLAGTVSASSGNIMFNDKEVTNWPEYRRSNMVGRVFQDPLRGTAPDLSVLDNFRLSSLRTSNKTLKYGTTAAFTKQVKDEVSTLGLGLEDKLNEPIGRLSGGQRQALTLLMASMDSSLLLLLDEPVAALDPRTSDTIMRLTQKIIDRHKLTALMVTHSLKHACEYGSRLIYLRHGIIKQDITGAEKQRLTQKTLMQWFIDEE